MDCETYQRRLLENPEASSEILDAHRRKCPACAAFANRLRSTEIKIRRALQFDVQRLPPRASTSAMAARPAREQSRRRSLIARGGLAAVFVGTLALYSVLAGGPVVPTEPALAAAVVDHWREDTAARQRTYDGIDDEALREALSGQVSIDPERLGTITYANSCYVFGNWVPHLSVRGSVGTIMVVFFPGRPVDEAVPLKLSSHGLRGRIVPAGDGGIAILADEREPLEPLERRLVAAVNWTL